MDTPDNRVVETWGGGQGKKGSMGKKGNIYNAFNNKDLKNKIGRL